MDFTYPDDVLEVRRVARDFAEKEIRPHVMEWDEAQIFPLDVVKKLGGLGYLGSIFPEELGGRLFGKGGGQRQVRGKSRQDRFKFRPEVVVVGVVLVIHQTVSF